MRDTMRWLWACDDMPRGYRLLALTGLTLGFAGLTFFAVTVVAIIGWSL